MRVCASRVPAPMWGVQETAGCWARAQLGSFSLIHTSRPAARTLPLFRASSRDPSSTLLPRETLTITTPSFIFARDSPSTRGLSPPGAQRTIMSDWASSSSMETNFMVSHSQPSGLFRWTTERTLMPRAWPFLPTIWPMRP